MLKFHYYLFAEAACFIIALLLLNNSERIWQIVRLYIGFVVISEHVAYYWVYILHKDSNQLIYNIAILIEFGFGIWFFSKILTLKPIRSISSIAYLLFYLSYIVVLLIHNGIGAYFNFISATGSMIMIVLCMLYFYTLFQSEEYTDLLANPIFWFVCGYFIFYTTSISVDTFFEKLTKVQIAPRTSIRYLIMNILNTVLYGCWIKSFLCLKIKKKYLQPL